MKYSNQRSSMDQQNTQQNEPTKRLSSHPSQSRLRSSDINSMNTARSFVNIACAYHNDQKITNFCQNKECLLPLCPKCIGIHCQQHSKTGIFGNFVSIDDSLDKVQHNLKDYLQKLETFGRLLKQGKSSVQTKNKKINDSIVVIRRVFLHKMNTILSNFEKAINSICSIQQSVMVEQLRQSQQFSNILYENYNACLKKLMNPSERLQGIINYFHNEDAFHSVDEIQQRLQTLISRPDLTIQYNGLEEGALQTAFKQSILTSSLSNEIWSEFKLLNIRQTNSALPNRPAVSKINERVYVNLENFVSPLEQFSLTLLRSKRVNE